MGFFSWDCKGCGNSMRSAHAVTKTSAWMKQVVIYTKGSKTARRGEYDGYGRVGSSDYDDDSFWDGREFTAYHKACHEIMGKPKFDGQSRDAHDQGYFVDDFVDPAKPKTLADLAYYREAAEASRERKRVAWQKAHEEYARKKQEEAAVASWLDGAVGVV